MCARAFLAGALQAKTPVQTGDGGVDAGVDASCCRKKRAASARTCHVHTYKTHGRTDRLTRTHTHSLAQGPAGDGAVPHRRLLFFWRLRNTALRELGPSAGVDVAQRVCPCVGVGVWGHHMTQAHPHAHAHARTHTHIHTHTFMDSWTVQVAGDVDFEPRVRMRGPLAGTQNAAQRDGARFNEQDTAGAAEVDRRTDAKGEGVGGGDGGAAEWIGMLRSVCVV